MGKDKLRPKSYDRFLAPMEFMWFSKWRKRILKDLSGVVLDIGSGTGINMEYYPSSVDCVTVVDPSEENLSYLKKKASSWGFGDGRCLELFKGYGEDLPFDEGEFDNVVSTLILCSVKDPELVVREGIRVLKKGGSFIFMEHQLPRMIPQSLMFRMVTPLWKAPSGCHLNRKTEEMIDGMDGLEKVESSRGGPVLGFPFYIARYVKE